MSNNVSGQIAIVQSLIEPITDDFGCELVDIEYNNGVLKVVIDEPGGLNSQTLVDVTKAVSRMIDAEDPIHGRFTLEISSPGVERPLKKPLHFERSIGETVLIKTEPGVLIAGERRAEGTLIASDESTITVEVDGEEHVLTYGQIRTARTVFNWGPTPKKGGPKDKQRSQEPTPESAENSPNVNVEHEKGQLA